jgi:uncharacterized membrane protein
MPSAARFFTEADKAAIRTAIEEAELNTSGEIRVHVDERCKGDVVPWAQKVFASLGMNHTKGRNGVLFYLAVRDRKFAIIGDAAIHQKVPEGFWDVMRDRMGSKFAEKKFTEALCEGIREAGQQLKAHFPYQTNDRNELGNEVTFNND